ncbi:MAG: hypothetical protein ACRCTE_12930 [Cellulosilyticaceae bacterium]
MKKLLTLLFVIGLLFFSTACSNERKINVQVEGLKEMVVGAELPYLLYANNDYCIMDMWHGGIIVYNFSTQEISDRITFEQLKEVGFSYPQPMVSADGEIIYFREDSQESIQPVTYSYNLQTKKLGKENDDVKEIIHHEDIFQNQRIQSLLSDGLAYGVTMIILDDTFVVSRLVEGGSLLSDTEIVFVKEDLTIEKTFHLFKE